MGGLLGGRSGIRAAGSLREVLTRTPAVDHHAHGILRAPPAGLDEFRGLFSESPDPRQWPHVATAVTYRRAVRVLAEQLGCEPTEAAVYERRLASDPHEYAASLLRATNTELLLLDEGFPSADIAIGGPELGELAGCPTRPVMRIEQIAESVGIGALDALREAVAGARGRGYVALPHVARPAAALYEALELAPASKLLYASDASHTPELYLLGARWWREALDEVLPALMPEDDAIAAARMILHDNARALYRL